MALELDHLHKAQLISHDEFIHAKLVLTREHRIEEKQEGRGSYIGKEINRN